MRLLCKGFKYVYVENDGSVRELDKEEQETHNLFSIKKCKLGQ